MTPEYLSLLKLVGCRLCKLLIDTDPDAPRTDAGLSFNLDFEFGVNRLGPQPLFSVLLGVKADAQPDAPPQGVRHIEVQVQGVFSLPDETPQEQIDALVPLNCFAMLYGIARGIVAQATGVTSDGAVWLPSVNFVALMQGPDEEPAAKKTPSRPRKSRPKAAPGRRSPRSTEKPH